MNIAQLRDELAAKRRQMHAIFTEAGAELDLTKVTSLEGDTAAKAAAIKARNQEIGDLAKKLEEAQALADIASDNAKGLDDFTQPTNRLGGGSGGDDQDRKQRKTLHQVLDESKEYTAFRKGNVKTARVFVPDEVFWEGKALITLSDFAIPATRTPRVQESVQLDLTVSDLMLQGSTDNNAITYLEETTFTNNAAEVAEGGTKPEGVLDWTERTDNVRKIATWIPVTDETLMDVPRVESLIRGRLAFMVERRRESQLINGDGIAPNLLGILNRVGIQTQAKGADPTPDAVYKAMTKIMVNADAEPTAALFHPNDWQDIRLLRTADGIYIWGSPAEVGPERIWGLTVRKTTAVPENTGLVGAFRPHAEFIRRTGIEITISSEHSTYFVENKVAILAEERVALAVYRPAAFCSVTGI
jgi:HK97 family phage major capsid protein